MKSELTAAFKMSDLRGMCEIMDKDYDKMIATCRADCLKYYIPESVIPFEEYLKLHLVRVTLHLRSNPDAINEYC